MTRPGEIGPHQVMIHVQHLLGVGHLSRAAALARACRARGLSTLLVSGGPPVAALGEQGESFLQLPPLKSRDADFSGLVDLEGRALEEGGKADRREALLAAFRAARPRVLVTELYPFGRRQLRFELEPLVAEARARPRSEGGRPWVISSLRDILNPDASDEKIAWMTETARRDFDWLLIHADPDVIRLEGHFPPAAASREKLRYTGYLMEAERPGDSGAEGRNEVLVSAGGGAVAAPLIEAALAARPHTGAAGLDTLTWRILAGGNLPQDLFEAFRERAPEGVVVERARPDFTALLARCRLSVSQAGYNSLLEVLRAGPPAVVVPFETPGEQEQAMRARLFARRGLVTHLPAHRLSPESLAKALVETSARPRGAARDLDLEGAVRSAEIIAGLSAKLPDEA